MKLGLFFLLAFFSLSVFANDFQGELRNLNITYNQPTGSATTDYLNIDQVLYDKFTQYEVQIQAGSLFLTTPDEMIQIDQLPSSVIDVDQLLIRNMNMLSNQDLIQLGFSQLKGVDPNQNQEINNFSISCNKELAGSTFNETLLHSCLNINGRLRIGKYSKDGKEQLSSLKFDTAASKLKYEIKISGLKVKGDGRTYYQNNMVRIRIDKAKVGPINVKKKLFDELKKQRSASFRVNSPWIEIDV